MSSPVPITVRFKYKSITVYIAAKPSETVANVKENLAVALNETKVLNRKITTVSTKEVMDEEDDEVDIPLPSFATSSAPATAAAPNESDGAENEEDDEVRTVYGEINAEDIKIGEPIKDNDTSSGFREIKSTANGKPQKLDAIGIKSNTTLAFTPTLDEEFQVDIMKDEYYGDEE